MGAVKSHPGKYRRDLTAVEADEVGKATLQTDSTYVAVHKDGLCI